MNVEETMFDRGDILVVHPNDGKKHNRSRVEALPTDVRPS